MFTKFIEVWDRLTLSKLLLGVLGGFSTIVLYWVWEQRSAVFITLTGSPFSMLTIAAVVVLVVMAWVAAMFVGMSEQRTALVIRQMEMRITDGEAHSERQDSEIRRLHGVIDQAVRDEREACDARIEQILEVMAHHGIKDRRTPSKFGDLK